MQFIRLQSPYNKNEVFKNGPILIGMHMSSAQVRHPWLRMRAAPKVKRFGGTVFGGSEWFGAVRSGQAKEM